MEDFCDGVLYKSDEFLLRSPNALHIHMYSDEFEICNSNHISATKFGTMTQVDHLDRSESDFRPSRSKAVSHMHIQK